MNKPEWALRAESIEPRRGFPTREEWGPGEWQSEPDLVEWRDAATGYPCLIVRGSMGALCGYVGLPPGHPLHGKGYSEAEQEHESLNVHGGLTYADACDEGGHICHVPLEGEPADVWWLGFDCNHSGDLAPGMDALTRRSSGTAISDALNGIDCGPWRVTYKPIGYVRSEVESLAAQLAALTSRAPDPPPE